MPKGSQLPPENQIAMDDEVIAIKDYGTHKATVRTPKSSFLEGLQGPPGEDGAQGPEGPQGPAGSDATVPSELLGAGDGWCIDLFEDYDEGPIAALDKGFGWGANGVVVNGTIVSQALADGNSEKRLVLSNGYLGRKMRFAHDWNRLQLAVLWRFTGSSNFTANGNLGVCSGNANMFNSAACENYFGMYWDPSVPTTWAHNAGTLRAHYSQATGTRHVTKRLTTITDRGSGSGSDGRRYVSAADGRSVWFMDITRTLVASPASSATYTVTVRSSNTTLVESSLSKQTLLAILLDSAGGTTGTGQTANTVTNSNLNSQAYSFDESTGLLDTFNLGWGVAGPDMHVCGIAARKIY